MVALSVILSLVMVLSASAPLATAAPTTYYVDIASGDNANPGTQPLPFRTIEAAVAVATAGDTILVAPGTYGKEAEQDFPIGLPPGVKLASTGGAAVTTIQSDGSFRAIRMVDPIAGSEVSGFTITDGGGDGACVLATRSSGGVLAGWPKVTDCVLEGNGEANAAGGALHFEGSSGNEYTPVVSGCTIRGNTGGNGGAIYCGNFAGLTLTGCTVEQNSATFGGGGIFSSSTGSSITIADCDIRDNSAGGSGGGIYLSVSGASISLSGTDMEGNTSGSSGGGIYSYGATLLAVDESTITENDASSFGGGAYLTYTSATISDSLLAANDCSIGGALYGVDMHVTLDHCTVADNTGSSWAGVYSGTANGVTARNTILWGHGGRDISNADQVAYCCVGDDDLSDNGNAGVTNTINMGPAFEDASALDYRLTFGSPCVDAADPSGYSAADFFGTLRPVDGDLNGTSLPDIGFHELEPDPALSDPLLFRSAGSDRYATACAIAMASFPAGAEDVIVASGQNFPDALSAAGLAGAKSAPLLLVRTGSVPGLVSDTLGHLGAKRVTIVGGPGAVSNAVETALTDSSYTVTRIAGADRYATAAEVAVEVAALEGGSFSKMAFIARGDAFPDALALSPLSCAASAFGGGAPILLTRPNSLPPATAAALDSLDIETAVVAGGVGAVSVNVQSALDALLVANGGSVSKRWSGPDRYATAAAVAEGGVAEGLTDWAYLGIATGQAFPDALAGGAAVGMEGGVVLLTRAETLSESARLSIVDHRAELEMVEIFGGTGAVSAVVESSISSAMGL